MLLWRQTALLAARTFPSWTVDCCHASEFKTEQALKNHFATHKKDGHLCAIETCSEVQRSLVRLHACPFDLGDESCYHIFDSKAAFEEHMSRHIQEMSCHELRRLWSLGNAISKFLLYGSLRDAWLGLLGSHYDSQSGKTCPRFSWSPAAEKTILDHLERATLPPGVVGADAFVRYIFDASTQQRLDVFPRLPPRPNPALAWTEDDAVECDGWSASGQSGCGAVDNAIPGRIEGFPCVPSDSA
ncbi:hypothetical protein NpPPO83_00011592 [Neofusicoccum parvum]|uniref:Uncharacterized protein n=1 Tax=Neofusicoccum parvum TaxID=310453 RepID=A0ACB5SFE7_9PEZI|nr:hypothetical protein NpPPO83_00011592 [Neofusicoccum parvum]